MEETKLSSRGHIHPIEDIDNDIDKKLVATYLGRIINQSLPLQGTVMIFGTGGDVEGHDRLKEMFYNPNNYTMEDFKGKEFKEQEHKMFAAGIDPYQPRGKDADIEGLSLESLKAIREKWLQDPNDIIHTGTIRSDAMDKLEIAAREGAVAYTNKFIKESELDTNLISDGYHTFGELYDHRIQLFICLCEAIDYKYIHAHLYSNELGRIEHSTDSPVWKSKKHSDGELAFGGTWFVLGINKEAGKQITYHLPISDWNKVQGIIELETAPEWDGHTPADVLERLKNL